MDTSVGLTVEGLVELKRKMDELTKGCLGKASIYGHSVLPSLLDISRYEKRLLTHKNRNLRRRG